MSMVQFSPLKSRRKTILAVHSKFGDFDLSHLLRKGGYESTNTNLKRIPPTYRYFQLLRNMLLFSHVGLERNLSLLDIFIYYYYYYFFSEVLTKWKFKLAGTSKYSLSRLLRLSAMWHKFREHSSAELTCSRGGSGAPEQGGWVFLRSPAEKLGGSQPSGPFAF